MVVICSRVSKTPQIKFHLMQIVFHAVWRGLQSCISRRGMWCP